MKLSRYMKRIITFAIALVFISAPVFVDARVTIYYEKVSQEYILGGVLHKQIDFLTSNGWMQANVIEADMSNENIWFEPLFSQNGVGTLSTVKTHMQENTTAIAGVNADFFSWGKYSGTGSPIGGVIKDGELVSSGANTNAMAAFVQYKDALLHLENMNPTISLLHNGNPIEIGGMNKYADVEKAHVYTSAWGAQYVNEYTDVYCIVVENNKIKDIIAGQKYTDIPKNGYIVACVQRSFPISYLNVGDELKLQISNITDAVNAIGGGTMLLDNGEETAITHNISGRHPRTAVGISKDSKTLYFVTIDGRQGYSIGATLPELAGIMKHIGAYSALNFDGGGSTSMVLRDLGGNVVQANTPSENRKVANTAAILMSNLKGKLAKIVIQPKQNSYYVGETAAVDVLGFDEYGNLVELDESKIKLSDLKAKDVGKLTISAQYNNLKATSTVDVFQPVDINSDKQKAEIENAEYVINIIGNMNQGKTLGDSILARNFAARINNNEMNIVASKYAPAGLSNIVLDTSVSQTWTKDDNLFIALDIASGRLGELWTVLKSLTDTVNEKKVFLILNSNIKDVNEWEAFLDTLEQNLVLKGKEVYVISQADSLKFSSRNGIRVVTTSNATQGAKAENILDLSTGMKYLQLQFSKNGEIFWTMKGI